jgi:predicted dehydrogenase
MAEASVKPRPPTADGPLRVGVVGCGSVLGAYAAVAQPLVARGELELRVACGRPQQRDRVASLGFPRFVTEEAEVTDALDVDLVLVLTSMPSHARLVEAALRAGKHVLCEKPLATDLPTAAALVDLAARSPGHLLVAPFTPLSPTFGAMRARLAAIGRVVSARARYGWAGPDWHDWFYKPGAGVLLDLGIYPVATLLGLLGPARSVTALTGVAIPERLVRGQPVRVEAEDNATIAITHDDGALSLVTTGYTMQQVRSPAVEVYGVDGTIQMLGDDWDPDGFELYRKDVGAWQLFKETDPEWPWTDGLPHLVAAIRAGRAPALPPSFAYHTLEVLLAARASGERGERVEVASRFPAFALEAPASGEPIHLVHDRARRAGEAR